jgi:hypothetical protein
MFGEALNKFDIEAVARPGDEARVPDSQVAQFTARLGFSEISDG